jgi:hypothetical protein
MPNQDPHTVPLEAYSDSQSFVSKPSIVGSKAEKSQPENKDDFQPSDFSVVCGRGRDSFNHIGNRRFRILASMFIERYSRANSKAAKTVIVSEIIEVIRQADGNFCKYKKGKWFEVADHHAREKVSALLRDLLHTQYRSSAKAKIARRKTAKTEIRKKKKQKKQSDQKLVDDTPHSDDSSTSSSSEIREQNQNQNKQSDQMQVDDTPQMDDLSTSSPTKIRKQIQNQQSDPKPVDDTPHPYDPSTSSSSEIRNQNQNEKSGQKLVDGTPRMDDSLTSSSTEIRNQNQNQNQQSGPKPVDDTPHSDDDSSTSSLTEIRRQNQERADDTRDSDNSSTSSTCWGSTKDSLGYEYWLEDNFFDIDVF